MQRLEQRLRQRAMDWLAKREYTRHELAQKLARRFAAPPSPEAPAATEKKPPEQASEAQIEALLDWLEARAFLSDERCAGLYVRSHIERGHGVRRIRQELIYKRGLDAALVDSKLGASDCDWFALAADVLTRRFHKPPASLKEKARQLRFLQGRGFSAEQCYYALDQLQASEFSD